MKALTSKTLTNRVNSIITANDDSALYEVLVNTIYQGVVHGNIMAITMLKLRNSKANGTLKATINKLMPMTYHKADGAKKEHYSYNKAKREKLFTELGLTETSTLDDVANAVANPFGTKKAQANYDRAKYLAAMAKKLNKEEDELGDDVAGIVGMLLANPDLISDVMVMALNAQNKADKAA